MEIIIFKNINKEIEDKLSFLKLIMKIFEIETNVTENFSIKELMGD